MAKIKITPLAFESMGVRSMCTLVETKDLKVLVDPGVSVAPRFSLMPHPEEYAARNNSRLKMRKAAEKADVVTISHYHYDHHTPNYVDTVWCRSSPEEAKSICGGKLVLAKNTKSHVNTSQRRRGWLSRRFQGNLSTGLKALTEDPSSYTKLNLDSQTQFIMEKKDLSLDGSLCS